MNKIIEKFVEDMRRELFRSWYDDVNLNDTGIENNTDESERFMLMINNFSYPFEEVLYSENLQELSDRLNNYIKKLDNKYDRRTEYENLISNKNTLVAFRGYWSDGENNYFHEGIIIKAKKLN